jgi:hypothetical protein
MKTVFTVRYELNLSILITWNAALIRLQCAYWRFYILTHILYGGLVPIWYRRQWASVRNTKWRMLGGEINLIYCKTRIGHTHTHTHMYTFLWLGNTSGHRHPLSWVFETTLRLATLGRTPLDEWSFRRRDLYLTTHNTHNGDRQPCPRRDWNPQYQQASGRKAKF